MKRFKIEFRFLLFVFLFPLSQGCDNGMISSFLMSTNVILKANSVATNIEITLEQCTEECRRQLYCQSLVYQRNATNSVCRLFDVTLNTASDGFSIDNKPNMDFGSFYLEKICLKNECQRLFAVELVVGGQLEEQSVVEFHNITRENCLEKCFREKRFVCRSSVWDSIKLHCRLSRFDRFTRSTRFKYAENSLMYFDNNCVRQPVFEGTTAEVILLGNAEHAYILSEYTGKSVGECGQLCLKSLKFPCRSFLYGRKNGSTYCALSHQNRIGMFKNRNTFSPTDLLNYYEIAPKLEVCDDVDVHYELTSGVYYDKEPFRIFGNVSQSECLQLCRKEAKCDAVSVDHNTSRCLLQELTVRSTVAGDLRENYHYNYFEKLCLPAASNCKQQWVFERVRSKKLASLNFKKAVSAVTKEECLALCLEHEEFQCQSAEYDQRLSECLLISFNRFSSSEKTLKIQTTRQDIDYFENNCFHEPRGFCNTKHSSGYRFTNFDEIKRVNKLNDCKIACLNNTDFNCHSYAFNLNNKECYLSHHSAATVPYLAHLQEHGVDLYEITTCYDVSVSCDPHVMQVHVHVNSLFDGKIYVRHRPETCFLDVNRTNNFTFPVVLTGPECGTESEAEGKFSNVIVIQNNDLVLTSNDKAIGVHCTYELGNKTEYAVFTIKNLTGASETSRGRASPPKLTMRILDSKGRDKTSVKLGEPLTVQVSVPDESAYGIFVRNMVATDGTGHSNVTLIDSKGCPAEAKMIREMRRIEGHSRALESVMEAFTFTGSNVLHIETDVETCLDACHPVMCHVPSGRSDDQYLSVESFGRKRRSADDGQVFRLKKSVAIHSDKFAVGTTTIREFKKLTTKSSPIFNDQEEYEYIQEVVEPTGTENVSNGGVCMDTYTLAIGGCAFILIQLVLLIVCLSTKHYQRRQGAVLRTQLAVSSPNSSKFSELYGSQLMASAPSLHSVP
ncbi:hypothetical protein CHUAL_012802 [Chamberlinius hualienensis]